MCIVLHHFLYRIVQFIYLHVLYSQSFYVENEAGKKRKFGYFSCSTLKIIKVQWKPRKKSTTYGAMTLLMNEQCNFDLQRSELDILAVKINPVVDDLQ